MLYATKDEDGKILIYPEPPRYSKELDGFVCRFGEFILSKTTNKDLVKHISKSIKDKTDVFELPMEIEYVVEK